MAVVRRPVGGKVSFEFGSSANGFSFEFYDFFGIAGSIELWRFVSVDVASCAPKRRSRQRCTDARADVTSSPRFPRVGRNDTGARVPDTRSTLARWRRMTKTPNEKKFHLHYGTIFFLHPLPPRPPPVPSWNSRIWISSIYSVHAKLGERPMRLERRSWWIHSFAVVGQLSWRLNGGAKIRIRDVSKKRRARAVSAIGKRVVMIRNFYPI